MTLLCGTGNAAVAALAKGARAIATPMAAADNHGAMYLMVFVMVLLPSRIAVIGCAVA
jgi:hypothetical protein